MGITCIVVPIDKTPAQQNQYIITMMLLWSNIPAVLVVWFSVGLESTGGAEKKEDKMSTTRSIVY